MRPLILITNDDGVTSTGLRAAAEAADPLGDVLVVAPRAPQTAMGRSFPNTGTQGVIEEFAETLDSGAFPYYAVDGSPAQAVAHAMLEIAPYRPRLCISGINNGENLGGTILLSGTVGAALEASAFGVPALAVSVGPERPDELILPYDASHWQIAAALIRRFAASILRDGLPRGVDFLNINIPLSATCDTKIRTTVQSRQNHYMCIGPGQPRDLRRPFRLPVAGSVDFATLEPDSDLYAFFIDAVVSVTPMARDLTMRDGSGRPFDVVGGITARGGSYAD